MEKIEKIFQEKDIEWWNPVEGVDKRAWFFNKQLLFIKSVLCDLRELGYSVALDAGCGRGRYSQLLRSIGFRSVFSLDINNEMLKTTLSCTITPCVQASLMKMPFEESSFDVVISIGTLMHVPYAELALREIYRVLKPSGVAIVSSANVFSLYSVWTTRLNPILAQHQNLYHRRQFSFWEFIRMLEKTGFTLLESRGFSTISPLSILPRWKITIIPVFLSRWLSKILDPMFSKRFGCSLTFVLTKP